MTRFRVLDGSLQWRGRGWAVETARLAGCISGARDGCGHSPERVYVALADQLGSVYTVVGAGGLLEYM